MSYSNQTTNYGLPQYEANDKPTYLGDFNKAMLDIDTNMKSIDTKAESAVSTANNSQATATQAQEQAESANTTAESAQATATQAQTSATQAQSTATQAQSTATQAQSTATEAQETANNNEQTLNNLIESLKWVNYGNVSTASTTGSSSNGLTASYNPALKLLNMYGYNHFSPDLSDNSIIGKLPEQFPAPATDRKIESAGGFVNTDGTNTTARLIIDTQRNIKLDTDGKIVRYSLINVLLSTAFWN